MRTQELSSKPAFCCNARDALSCAAQLMWDHDCGAIPVVDDAGRLVGIVTDRDVCMAAYTQGQPLDAIPVSTAMARQVFSVHPEDSIEEAEKLMAEKQVRRIPIVDGENRPVGMLSMNDLARDADSPGRAKNGVSKVLHTLAAICRPHAKVKIAA